MAMAAFKPSQRGSGIGCSFLRDAASAAGNKRTNTTLLERIVIAQDAERAQRDAELATWGKESKDSSKS